MTTIGLWTRFETGIHNKRHYADPYRDVTLEATYTRPDGTSVDFWGFHDGGATWYLRFMPDQIGTWSYRSVFTDGTPGPEGRFECVPSDRPGLVSAFQENPVWFGYRGGGALMVRSLHVGDRFFAANWPDERRTAFLDWAHGQGYNMLSVASHYLNRDVEGRGKGWDTPDLWPLDPAEFRRLEGMLDELERRRFVVFPFAGFFGQDADFPQARKDQELYIRYILARLGAYWNMVFNVAGPEPLAYPQKFGNIMMYDDVCRLGRLIRDLDPFGHLVTIHNGTTDDPFRDEEWVGFGTTQGPKTTDRVELGIRHCLNHHPARPLYAQETLWSGNLFHPDYSDEDVRKNAFVMNMCAASINFADHGASAGEGKGHSSEGFSGTLELDNCRQWRHDIMRRVWDFMESIPFQRMRPRPDLVTRGWCLAEEGRRYLVYLEDEQATDVLVSEGSYAVSWINARETGDRADGGTTTDAKALSPPGPGDWILDLDRRS